MKRTKRTEMMIGVAVVLALLLTGKLAVEVKTEAAAMTITVHILTVTSTDDHGPGTLRQAIADATAGDTIAFDLSYPATITLTSGHLAIHKNLTIEGPGAQSLKVSGNHSSLAFFVDPGVSVTIAGLTIADSNGGIRNAGGTLAVTDCTISGNKVDAIGSGGGILNAGTLTVTGSTFFDNHADGGTGGAISSSGLVTTLTSCTFSDNQAIAGGALYLVGAAAAQLTLTNSTLSDNHATAGGNGGGIDHVGGT